VDKAIAGEIGVPINYYLKSLTKTDIEQAWVAKYFPDQYITISVDDSHPGPQPGPTPGPTPQPS
jgi:hypothetical protein